MADAISIENQRRKNLQNNASTALGANIATSVFQERPLDVNRQRIAGTTKNLSNQPSQALQREDNYSGKAID
jgi:hypothetical protein